MEAQLTERMRHLLADVAWYRQENPGATEYNAVSALKINQSTFHTAKRRAKDLGIEVPPSIDGPQYTPRVYNKKSAMWKNPPKPIAKPAIKVEPKAAIKVETIEHKPLPQVFSKSESKRLIALMGMPSEVIEVLRGL